MKPTIGRIVHYRLTAQDADSINRRRQDAQGNLAANDGAVRHVGNSVYADQLAAMIVTAVDGGSMINGQVLLDGNGAFWATSRIEGTGPGEWSWPVIEWPSPREAYAGPNVDPEIASAEEANPHNFTPAA